MIINDLPKVKFFFIIIPTFVQCVKHLVIRVTFNPDDGAKNSFFDLIGSETGPYQAGFGPSSRAKNQIVKSVETLTF